MFYDKLKKLCLGQGISVSKLAVDLKISTTTVTGWKRGAKPQPAQVKKIAEYFKVFPDELTRDAPDETSSGVSRDDKADLMDIIKSQQEAIRNLSESVRNLSDVRLGG
jgi:transcriptional regulator with XRE-family HTH domain